VHVTSAVKQGDATRAVCSSARCPVQVVHHLYVIHPCFVIRTDVNNLNVAAQQS